VKQQVLCLNTGSSSLKFAFYSECDLENALIQGAVERIGDQGSQLTVKIQNQSEASHSLPIPTYQNAVQQIFRILNEMKLPEPSGCVHRLVHGGANLAAPLLISPEVRKDLQKLIALAPLHLPTELSVVDAAILAYPDIPHFACFDTAFHQRMPAVAKRLPITHSFWDRGIRRYGFHGLSYESIVSQLGNRLPKKTIIAHLGNGCSMVALKEGVPKDTTMGLTPTGGLMMGTRSGDLDPGVLFYLLRASASEAIQKTEYLLNDEAGLLGVSGISRNMEDLLKAEEDSIRANEAIELFCYSAKKALGSLYAVLGGLDALIFTGGMGENSAVIRNRICENLTFLQSPCEIKVLHTDENRIMAEHAFLLLSHLPTSVVGVA
jgi:acetate kinase